MSQRSRQCTPQQAANMNVLSFNVEAKRVPGQGVIPVNGTLPVTMRAQSIALPSVEQFEYNPAVLMQPPPSPSPSSIRWPSQTWSASPQPTRDVSAKPGRGGIRLDEKQEQILLQIMYQLRDTYNQNGHITEWWRQVQFQLLEATNIEYKNARQYSEEGLRAKFTKGRKKDLREEYPDGL